MSTLASTLWISLISIVLLFAAMAVIWGLMALLARSPDKKDEPEPVQSAPVVVTAAAEAPAQSLSAGQPKAAALAVSVALALRNRSQQLVLNDIDSTVSSWQTVRNVSRVSQRNQLFARK